MNKKFTFHQLESTASIEQHAQEQLAKIEHFLEKEREPIFLELTFHDGKPHAHFKVDFLLKSPHYDLFVERVGPDLYVVMDQAIDAMYKQLRKEKDRHLEDRKMVGRHEQFKKQR